MHWGFLRRPIRKWWNWFQTLYRKYGLSGGISMIALFYWGLLSLLLGVLTVLIFDSFLIHFWSIFFHFCRHRPSKMKWKMNRKMRTVNRPPLKFWKMSEKMSEKWNSTFFGAPAALNSASRGRPCSILSFPQCLLSASNLPWVFTDWSSVH